MKLYKGTPPMLHKINARCFFSKNEMKHAGINKLSYPGFPSKVNFRQIIFANFFHSERTLHQKISLNHGI